MSSAALESDCRHFCNSLQSQIDALERNCVNEFRSLANYQQDRALAPLIHRLEALEAQIAQLTQNQPKGG